MLQNDEEYRCLKSIKDKVQHHDLMGSWNRLWDEGYYIDLDPKWDWKSLRLTQKGKACHI